MWTAGINQVISQAPGSPCNVMQLIMHQEGVGGGLLVTSIAVCLAGTLRTIINIRRQIDYYSWGRTNCDRVGQFFLLFHYFYA